MQQHQQNVLVRRRLVRRKLEQMRPQRQLARTDRSPAQPPRDQRRRKRRPHRPPRPQAAAAPPHAARISCRGTPSRSGNTVRRLSCRSTRSHSAPSSAARSSAPLKPHRQRDHIGAAASPPAAPGTTAAAAHTTAGSRRTPRCSRHQRRAAQRRIPPPTDSRACRCSRRQPATLGASNRLRIDTSTPSAARIRLISRVASSECPPSSKKLSSTPTRSTPQHLGKQRAQDRLLRRARRTMRLPDDDQAPAPAARAGRACRSASAAADPAPRAPTAPCSPASCRPQRSPQRSSVHAPLPPPPPHSRSAAGRPSPVRPRDHHSLRHTLLPRSTASISPGSIRKPRSFTCASARPRNSSTPSARHRARSPVRYIRRARPAATPCRHANRHMTHHAGRRQTAPPSDPTR